MNGYIYIIFYITGLLSFVVTLLRNRAPKILTILMCLFFVVVVVSRQYGYKDYSDLGAYIDRFQRRDNSYFSRVYCLITDAIRMCFGNSATAYLIVVSTINLLCAVSVSFIVENEVYSVKCMCHQNANRNRTFCVFIFLYAIYWGLSFSAEVIRSGLAISASLISVALILYNTGKWSKVAALFLYVISLSIHWTQIILFPFLIYIALTRKAKIRSYKYYFALSCTLLLLDILGVSYIVANSIVPFLDKAIKAIGMDSHYDVYIEILPRPSMFNHITLQYLYYHFLGIFLALRMTKNDIYIKLLNGYYWGLSLHTLLSGVITAIARVQWVLLVLSVFLLYIYLTDKNHLKSERICIGILFSAIQSIMTIRYLGIQFL